MHMACSVHTIEILNSFKYTCSHILTDVIKGCLLNGGILI